MSIEQRNYIFDLTERLADMQSVDTVQLPGEQAHSAAQNSCILGMTPLSEFGNLRDGNEFIERFGQAPHVVVRLGRMTMIALVEDTSTLARDGHHEQRLISLQHNGLREMTRVIAGPAARRAELGREMLTSKTGFNDRTVSRHHAVTGPFGKAWLVHDLSSLNGTTLSLEAGSAWTGGIKIDVNQADRERITDIIVPDFVPDFDTMGLPPVISGPLPRTPRQE